MILLCDFLFITGNADLNFFFFFFLLFSSFFYFFFFFLLFSFPFQHSHQSQQDYQDQKLHAQVIHQEHNVKHQVIVPMDVHVKMVAPVHLVMLLFVNHHVVIQ